MLYSAIEGSDGFYHSPVARPNRSNMNVPFTIPRSQDLEKEFLAAATKQGLVCLLLSQLTSRNHSFGPLELAQLSYFANIADMQHSLTAEQLITAGCIAAKSKLSN